MRKGSNPLVNLKNLMIDVRFLSHKNWNVCLRKIYCRSIQNAEISNGREAFAKGGNILYLLMTMFTR